MARKVSKVVENEFIVDLPHSEEEPKGGIPVDALVPTPDVSHSEEGDGEWSPEEEENFLDLVKIYVQVLLKQHDKDVIKELVRENKQWKMFVEETLGLSNYKIRKIVKDNKDEPLDKIVEKVMYEGDDEKQQSKLETKDNSLLVPSH